MEDPENPEPSQMQNALYSYSYSYSHSYSFLLMLLRPLLPVEDRDPWSFPCGGSGSVEDPENPEPSQMHNALQIQVIFDERM